MTTDTERIAEQLRADLVAPDHGREPVMASLFAESVDLRHVPARPTDGPLSGAMLRDVSIAESAAVTRALSDVVRDDVRVTVDGDSIHLQATVHGALPNGEAVNVKTDVVVEVRDGRIAALEARLTEADMARWGNVLVAGGFKLPTG